MEARFHPAINGEELGEGASKGLIVNGWPVLLARAPGVLHAVIDRCPHAASNLSSGKVRRGAVMCPLHGARFELASGRCIGGVYSDLKLFPVSEVEGWIEIEVPDTAPQAEYAPVG